MNRGLERHLAAILALDFAGYSRLMRADEQGTLERLLRRRQAVIDPTVQAYRGRVVKGTGDGVLAEFASAQNAIHGAVSIQKALAEANAAERDQPPMMARIGITIGDIFFEPDGDIFGDGVNIAARLESKAPLGGICVSGRALDDLRRVGVAYSDFGEIALKNIDQPVRIYCIHPDGEEPAALAPTAAAVSRRLDRRTALAAAGALLAAGLGGGLLAVRRWGAGAVGNSVAVIPFANLSGDATQTYFSDGLSEEIRGALARNAALMVAAPTSAAMFRDGQDDAKLIGSKLGVAFLLEGSVRRADQVVRITAELIDARTGFSRWSQTFDRSLRDVFAVQSEIANVVVNALSVRVVAPTTGGTTDVAAFDAFLRGQELFNADVDESSDREALAQYDAAIAADPSYAAAFAGRSRIQATIASEYADAGQQRQLYDKAIADARRAVAIAPDLATAQLALGLALYTGRLDVAAARDPYDKAAAAGVGDANVQLLFAVYCSRSGRARAAIAAVTRAMELDPINPRAFRAGGIVQYSARHYAAAIALSQKALALNATLRNAHANIGNSLLLLGRVDAARTAYLAEPLDLLRLPGLAIAEQRLGNATAARAAMDKLVSTLGDTALYQQAQVLAQWGDTEAALRVLDRARAIGDSGLLMALVDPLLDPLRKDTRFSHLLSALRLR